MLKHILVLPDGTEIGSGAGTVNAIQNTKLTQTVNADEELTLGSCCAAVLEMTLFTPGGGLTLGAGDQVILYRENGAGVRIKQGIFILERPTRPSANTLQLTGYDRVTKLDKELSLWLNSLTGWPYRLIDFARMVCNACELQLATDQIPNGDFFVPQFTVEQVTGRQLMRWVGEASCRFCRANADGNIELAWYADSGLTITENGEPRYYAKGLTYETYEVASVEAVQLKLADSEDGGLWPEAPAGANRYIIRDNPILLTQVTEEVEGCLQVIAGILTQMHYTPCRVAIPVNLQLGAGSIVDIMDSNGNLITAYIMTRTSTGQRDTLECTGSPRLDSTGATNSKPPSQVAQEKADAAQKKALEAALAQLNTYAQSVTVDMQNLQNQIDGNITTWFYSHVPTTENAPANEWTTEALKTAHLGDLFYVVDNPEHGGFAYRWALLNGVYQWSLVEDVEVAKALAQARAAKDTADSKRRVFVATPTPPYDVGDLWTQGPGGCLMRCRTAKTSGTYIQEDWELAADYINAADAEQIAQERVDAQTQTDIFNKLTDNGKIQGLYVQDGKWYINAEVAQIINLVAEKLVSVLGDSTLQINGASLELYSSDISGPTVSLTNSFSGFPILYMNTYDCGAIAHRGAFSGNQIRLGGTSAGGVLLLGVDWDNKPYLILDPAEDGGSGLKYLSWKSNGDGTYTLIGS